jgi:hypothetical protein
MRAAENTWLPPTIMPLIPMTAAAPTIVALMIIGIGRISNPLAE